MAKSVILFLTVSLYPDSFLHASERLPKKSFLLKQKQEVYVEDGVPIHTKRSRSSKTKIELAGEESYRLSMIASVAVLRILSDTLRDEFNRLDAIEYPQDAQAMQQLDLCKKSLCKTRDFLMRKDLNDNPCDATSKTDTSPRAIKSTGAARAATYPDTKKHV